MESASADDPRSDVELAGVVRVSNDRYCAAWSQASCGHLAENENLVR
jgi:hypothetical protein